MRYRKYLIVLDLFGLVAVASAIVFWRLPNACRPSEHLDNLWGGATTEMLGIWMSVRFIDWIISSHENSTKIRVRVVRGMRLVERLVFNLYEFQKSHELRVLLRELSWTKQRFGSRKKVLSSDEIRDVEEFYSIVDELVALLPAGVPAARAPVEIKDMAAYEELMQKLEIARRKAEENIFDETDEDSGL